MHVKSTDIDNPDSPEHAATDVVACINCKELYGKKTGTATLYRHKCPKYLPENQNQIEKYAEVLSKKPKNIPKYVKDDTIQKLVEYCSLDIRPRFY